MKKLYLAHPFDSRLAIRELQNGFEERTGIKLINPFYDIHREDIIAVDEGRRERREQTPKDAINIVERDIEAIKNSDGIVAFVNGHKSIGTLMEIVYSSVVFDKPTFVICVDGQELHPWLQYHACGVFTSLDEFEEWINDQT